MPAASSASLRPISSVAIDFDFATSFAPRRRQTSTTYAHASSAVAQTFDVAAAGLERRRELVEVAVDVADRLHADLVRALAQLLDVGELAPGLEPVRAQPLGRDVDRALHARVGELRARDLAEALARGWRELAHAAPRRAPARSRGGRPRGPPVRAARPRRCIRQPGSAVTSASAPTAPRRRACRRPSRPRPRAGAPRTCRRNRSRDRAAAAARARAGALEQPARRRRDLELAQHVAGVVVGDARVPRSAAAARCPCRSRNADSSQTSYGSTPSSSGR